MKSLIIALIILIASLSLADDGYKLKRANDGISVQTSRATMLMRQVTKESANHSRICEQLREISERLLDYYEDTDYRGRAYIESTQNNIRDFCR